MRGPAAAVAGGGVAARRSAQKLWSLKDSYGFIAWHVSTYSTLKPETCEAGPRSDSKAVRGQRNTGDHDGVRVFGFSERTGTVSLGHKCRYHVNSRSLNSSVVGYGDAPAKDTYQNGLGSSPGCAVGRKISGNSISSPIRDAGTYDQSRKGLHIQKRHFHDYFVTNLPSSSLHPDSRGPHHKLPRSASTPHTPGPGSSSATPLSVGPSRELTVVRIPLRKAKHHFGVSLSRGTRPYNEDAFQAGTLEIPAFAKRKAISLSRSKSGAMISDGSGTSAESASGDPQVFYFGVFDGHGGNECSDFLSQELHNYVESAAESFGLQSSLKDTQNVQQGIPSSREENILAEASSTGTSLDVTESNKPTPLQLEQELVAEWRETVGGYFRRFKPEYFEVSSKSRGNKTSTSTQIPITLEPVLMYAFLKADLDFVTAQAHKPDSSDTNSDKPLNEDDILDSPALLKNRWIGGPTRFIGGSTASIALISTPTPTPFWHPATPCTIITAHVGDTRIILCDTATGLAKPITTNHHPSTPLESTRLRRYAATFSTDSFGEERMSGLANTRAFGDMRSKRIGVSAEPEITRVELLPAEYSFLVLVSDGVSGTLDDQEIVDIVKEAKTPEQAARDVVSFATEVSSEGDNATCLVVRLGGWERRNEGGLGSLGTKERRDWRKADAADPRRGRT
ncbi:phosphatase 2C-like domain-containing protein [Xylogone sp. PMI_703]|nr:phosphatase 2C-like domain-containing protein [Xylogone sp. PMI_703]